MGDRANIVVTSDDGTIHFYSHWGGYEIAQTAAEGLDRGRPRWGDDPYLNRIIFSTMIEDDVTGETGFGISVGMGDGGTEVYIDHRDQAVNYEGETYTFDEFIDKFKGSA